MNTLTIMTMLDFRNFCISKNRFHNVSEIAYMMHYFIKVSKAEKHPELRLYLDEYFEDNIDVLNEERRDFIHKYVEKRLEVNAETLKL